MNTRFLYFNKIRNLSKLFVTIVILILSVYSTTALAQKHTTALVKKTIYDSNDKEGLRKFLRQPSVVEGQLNLHRLGLTIKDTINWYVSEKWVQKVDKLTWNDSDPKRLTHIGGKESYDTILIGGRPYRTNGWDMKGIKGDLDATYWQMLECLDIHNSTDYLGKETGQLDSIRNSINSLKVNSNLKKLVCEAIGLKSLTGNFKNITRLLVRFNCLSDLDLTDTNEEFTDFSGGGQTVSLIMRRNKDGTIHSGNISLNNPLFFNIDGTQIPSDSISYIGNILTDKRRTPPPPPICFIAETGTAHKRIGGVIYFKLLLTNKEE